MALSPELVERVKASPKYRLLLTRRTRLGWLLTALMLVAYFGYIGLIAFDKPALARPVGAGVTSIGIPAGIGLILFTILLTGVYVLRANSEFDRLTREIVDESGR
jgi:uncharacterized membrane protein (DUF485 family)